MKLMTIAAALLFATNSFAQAPAPDAPTPPSAPAAVDNPVLVTVNGEVVKAGEVRLVMQNISARMGQNAAPMDQEQIEDMSMLQAIDMRLLVQEATRLEITSDDARVDQILASIAARNGGEDGLATNLARGGIELADLRHNIADTETVRAFAEEKIKPTIEVTDQDLETYYQDNPDRFKTAAQVHARHILITIEADATTEDKSKARELAEAARARATAGEEFAALAKELSQGPSGPQGGDLGFFTADRMVAPFSEAAFALEAGAISEVVESQFGYHVITVEEKQAASTVAFDEVKIELRSALEEQKIAEALDARLIGLRDAADVQFPTAPTADDVAGEVAEPAQD